MPPSTTTPVKSNTDSTYTDSIIRSSRQKFDKFVILDNIPQRQVLLLTLLESEQDYIRHMNIFNLIYYEKIMGDRVNNMAFIFPPYIYSLITFCKKFYIDLKSRLRDLLRGVVDRNLYRHVKHIPNDRLIISDIFTNRLEEFEQFYVEYPFIYDKCRNSINDTCAINTDFSEFLKQRRDLPVCEGMSVENFLLLPLQRLSTYAQFLQLISKKTDDSHPDAKRLRTLNKKLRLLLHKQEQNIAKVDNWHQVIIQSKKLGLPQLLANQTRTFIREGKLNMPQSKDLNSVGKNLLNYKELDLLNAVHMQVVCVLFSDSIVISATNIVSKLVRIVHLFELTSDSELIFNDIDTNLSPTDTSSMEGTGSIGNDYNVDTEFQLILPDKNKVLVFNADTREEKIAWCNDIANVLSTLKG
jgi:hypothetical protein